MQTMTGSFFYGTGEGKPEVAREMHELVYAGIENINSIVETLPPEDAHTAISLLREHLKARAEQTASDDNFMDLIGV